MLIGELSRLTGASVRSLRYYEGKHLLQPQRRENGYRDHDKDAVDRVKTIQVYLSLGLTTDQIKEVIDCTSVSLLPDQLPACEQDLLALYWNKLQEVENQIETLAEVRNSLQERIARLENNESSFSVPQANQHSAKIPAYSLS